MDLVATIRRIGFRKWYERQLIDSHLCLTTCLLCGITLAAMVESIQVSTLDAAALVKLGVVVSAIVVGWLAWRRYIKVLQRAELYGEKSTCASCATYGRFEVLSSGFDARPGKTAEAVAPLPAAWMRVKCRKCGTTWRIPD